MKVLELFCGTKSVGKYCNELGWESISLDFDKKFNPTHLCDILEWDYKQYDKNYFDIIWASPDCTEYSKLQDCWLGRKKKGVIFTREAMENNMIKSDKLILKTLEIINYFNPELWFIENPQTGKLKEREIMKDIPFYDVDYCMYSDWGYKKRTRIWTNKQDWNNLLCNKKCGNIFNNVHKINLGGHGCEKTQSGISLKDKYRIPADLISSLLLE
tara:strand:+ start:5230 stop:5871 length:642 start_codon:yes stop_codon:yes gene_type:complete